MNFLPHPRRLHSRRRFGRGPRHPGFAPHRISTLANTPVGCWVRVIGFRPGLAGEQLTQLQSYGLAPGRAVRVLQQTPVTVLQIEQFELALEREMAALVEVAQNQMD